MANLLNLKNKQPVKYIQRFAMKFDSIVLLLFLFVHRIWLDYVNSQMRRPSGRINKNDCFAFNISNFVSENRFSNGTTKRYERHTNSDNST